MKYLRFVSLPFPAMEFFLPEKAPPRRRLGRPAGESFFDTVRKAFLCIINGIFLNPKIFRKSTRVQPLERQKTAGTAVKLTGSPLRLLIFPWEEIRRPPAGQTGRKLTGSACNEPSGSQRRARTELTLSPASLFQMNLLCPACAYFGAGLGIAVFFRPGGRGSERSKHLTTENWVDISAMLKNGGINCV